MFSKRLTAALINIAFAFGLAGCGAAVGDVTGVVTYRDQPLAGGTITYYDSGKKPVSSGIDEEGKYEVKQASAGPAKIAIVVPLNISFDGPIPGGKPTPKKSYPVLPDKYRDPEQSGLTFDIRSGKQTNNISLK